MSVSVMPQPIHEQQHWQDLPQWRQLLYWWQRQPAQRLQQLYSELQHQLRENGTTFDPWHQQQRQRWVQATVPVMAPATAPARKMAVTAVMAASAGVHEGRVTLTEH